MSVIGKHGITTSTPENILFGAGTYHRGLKWDSQSKAWTGEIIGATAGGGSVEIKGEVVPIELDGALVPVKGLAVKNGGTGVMEISFAELSTEVIKIGTLYEEGESDAEGYTMLKDKPAITEGDYVDNLAFVGKTLNGAKDIIVIFESALCTSGIKIEPKAKENAVVKLTMEAYAENQGGLDTLPIKIYYPNAAAAAN